MTKDKILIIDDDTILRTEIKECFEEYDFIEAKNITENKATKKLLFVFFTTKSLNIF